MEKTNTALILVGLIVILSAIFCPSVITEAHSALWRIAIGLLGCFSLVSGVYKAVLRK